MLFRKKKARIFVLGIDGVPFSFLDHSFNQGKMIKFARFARKNGIRRIHSVYPTVSSVAWTTYATGKNPGAHNIFGFVDRDPSPFSIRVTTARDRKAQTIWQKLSRAGKKVVVINVPLTYPPEPVNGILVSGFLCTDIGRASYPAEFNNYLKTRDYVIDVDAWLARKSKKDFIRKLHLAMEKRFEIAFDMIENEEWDFFQLHIMETDRLFHFYWNDLENKGEYYLQIESFIEKLDNCIGKLEEKLTENDRLLILSDHGFCGIKAEVQLNVWLEKNGLLKYEDGVDKKLENYHGDSICYSIIPGRIFLNLKNREAKGTVTPNDYEKMRYGIKQKLLDLKDPQTNQRIIDKVFLREEIYHGPYLERAADIIVHPFKGYDLKAKADSLNVVERSDLNGMHTYDDAFISGRNCDIDRVVSIQDVSEVII